MARIISTTRCPVIATDPDPTAVRDALYLSRSFLMPPASRCRQRPATGGATQKPDPATPHGKHALHLVVPYNPLTLVRSRFEEPALG